jgi:hypothetical protein
MDTTTSPSARMRKARKRPPLREEEWLDVFGVATEIESGPRTVRAAIQRGELRACQINGRGDTRVHRSWMMDWLTARAERG